MERKEKLWFQIEKVLPEPWTEVDARELAQLFGNRAFLKALQHAYMQVEGIKVQLATLDFSQPSAGMSATKLQGKIEGMIAIIDSLLDESEVPEKEIDDGSASTDDASSDDNHSV